MPPDVIRSEVVADSDGSALAFEPEERSVPVTFIRATARDVDFRVSEWRTSIGDHLKVRVFAEIYVYSTDAKELTSQSGARRCRHSPSLPLSGGRREHSIEERFEPAEVRRRGTRTEAAPSFLRWGPVILRNELLDGVETGARGL